MIYEIRLSKQAIKFLKKHPKEKEKYLKIFKEIAYGYEEALKKYDIKQMKGKVEETYRIRVGKYRAIYKLFNDILVIYVLDINSRGDIYK